MTRLERHLAAKPQAAADELVRHVGQYQAGTVTVDVAERGGALHVRMGHGRPERLAGTDPAFVTPSGRAVVFDRRTEPHMVRIDGADLPRRDLGAELVAAFQANLAASPPSVIAQADPPAIVQAGSADLVVIGSVDPRIGIDLAYATDDNFMGRAIYPTAIASLRRPVAEALSRVESALEEIGYGLLVYDAYRPWSVTKLFWDLVPEESRAFVADPAIGSNHNRGCAVDVTLRELAGTGAVSMPGRFDEPTNRSATSYEGGTSLERWHRDLLGIAMEDEAFAAHPSEWWHFDHATCQASAVLDVALDQVPAR